MIYFERHCIKIHTESRTLKVNQKLHNAVSSAKALQSTAKLRKAPQSSAKLHKAPQSFAKLRKARIQKYPIVAKMYLNHI